MEFEHQDALDRFRDRVETELLQSAPRRDVTYPAEALETWDVDRISAANAALLDGFAGAANLYALFVAPRNSTAFEIRYIGKTTRTLARQRLRNHLITKNECTGAKLTHIQDHVRRGGSVQVAWVRVDPESLRNYLEEELIAKHQATLWNRPQR